MVEPTTLPVVRIERRTELDDARDEVAVLRARAERLTNLLGKFLDAWNVRKDPDERDIAEAHTICYGKKAG